MVQATTNEKVLLAPLLPIVPLVKQARTLIALLGPGERNHQYFAGGLNEVDQRIRVVSISRVGYATGNTIAHITNAARIRRT